MSNQLVKRDHLEGYRSVFPKTFIDAIKDRDSGMSLAEILQGFNMYFLSYNGNKALTRCSVPQSLRKKGLWITYVLYDHTVITEWYNSDNIDDESFGSDDNWRQASNMLVGDISISADGYWVIEGKKTSTKAQGETGITPLLRFGSNNKLQASYNEGKDWQDISNSFTNKLQISKYIGINESLPTTRVEEGTIYMKGPYYDENDTNNDNPIYRMWIYAWKGNTLAWQDNGEFTSISAGVVQTTGNSETEVMSQAAVTKELTELSEELSIYRGQQELTAESKPCAIYASNKYMSVSSSNYGALVYPVVAGNTYRISVDIILVDANIAAVAFYGKETFPTSNTYVDEVIKSLDAVGVYEIDYTPSTNGFLLLTKIVSNNTATKEQSVTILQGQFIDFNKKINDINMEITDIKEDVENKANEVAQLQNDLAKLDNEFEQLTQKNEQIIDMVVGQSTIAIPSSASGWNYYPIPSLRKGNEYTFTLVLSTPIANTPLYWHLRNEDVELTGTSVVNSGSSQSTIVYKAADDYNDMKLALYSGAAIPSANLSIVNSQSLPNEIATLEKQGSKIMMASSKYFGATDLLVNTADNPRVINGQHKGRVDGVKISIANAGTLILALAKGTNVNAPSFEVIKTFNVVAGINYLDFDSPIMLQENWGIAIYKGSTAKFHRVPYGVNDDIGSIYFDGTKWASMVNGDVMAIYSIELSNLTGRLSNVEDKVLSTSVYPIAPTSLYSHLFINKIYLNSQPTIPSQSVFDVAIAAKLGFKILEFNVNITSDGVPITGHDVGGELQNLTDLNGNPVSVSVSSMTFAEIRSKYKYKSLLPQFRVPISSLEECLRECQRYDITPFVQCVNQSVIDLTESIVGNRYVAYSAHRTQTNATIYQYINSGSISELVERCEEVGAPYILGLTPSLLDAWSDDEIKELLAKVHSKGCWLNWAGCYHTAESNMRMRKLGLDSCASGWEVPEFNEYDIRKVGNAIKGFADLSGSFTTSAEGALLTNGQTMSADIVKMGALAKAQLTIVFKGKLNISFGEVSGTFESDGASVITMTSVVENKNADIVLTSDGSTIVYSVEYKTALVL